MGKINMLISEDKSVIPVVLFAYKRLDVLRRTMTCLCENKISKLIVFSDAPKTNKDVVDVESVRAYLSAIDWCEVEIHQRASNFGLGTNIIAGVTEVFERYDTLLVWEDDLICVPGTYEYLCSALRYYASDSRVMSVTGWTNQNILPPNIHNLPYFDGRAECLVWGTWRRAWMGMQTETAMEKVQAIKKKGVSPYKYGGDLPYMAKQEKASNIWAVRFLFHHILNRGLCMRPPWSMVEHIGIDERATNSSGSSWINNGKLNIAPPIPVQWPEPIENPFCAILHRKMCPRPWSDIFPLTVKIARWLSNIFRGQ
jgi:hypothetical protein